jgi:hypothetical protein
MHSFLLAVKVCIPLYGMCNAQFFTLDGGVTLYVSG